MVATRVGRAVERADAAVEDVDVVHTRLRANPANCDCPIWEAYLFGRWIRVAVDEQPTAPADVSSWAADPGPVVAGTIVEATLEVTQRTVVAETGWPYRVVRVVPPADDP